MNFVSWAYEIKLIIATVSRQQLTKNVYYNGYKGVLATNSVMYHQRWKP